MIARFRNATMAKRVLEFPHAFRNGQQARRNSKYEAAVEALNGLPTRSKIIQNAVENLHQPDDLLRQSTVGRTLKFLNRSGISMERLDELSVIHVTGTKGKGSTCAFCESILRQHGYRTGFYSSPHLVSVNERFRINGTPVSHAKFADYFFKVYDCMMAAKENESDVSHYFQFLTVLAFNIFLWEKVDVAIVEVGIGGEFDCTNILRKVPVVGITSLGLDHTNMLGNSLEQIAWHKGGIMKKGARAFTVEQSDAAMQVLRERSWEINCTLEVVPPFREYKWESREPILGIPGDVQKLNASLALQLAHTWISTCGNPNDVPKSKLEVPQLSRLGLTKCSWPGRNQISSFSNIRFYMDGAHTEESIILCARWFESQVSGEIDTRRVLIFNTTGNRNSETLLKHLIHCNFDAVMFMPNIATKSDFPDDLTDTKLPDGAFEIQIKGCELNKQIWLQLEKSGKRPNCKEVALFPNLTDALNTFDTKTHHSVLITGSLHLVGAALSLIHPEFTQ